MVKEGDDVKIGTPLFFDKLKPDVRWASPASGKVLNIQFGDRRVIEKIEIEVKGKECLELDKKDMNEICELKPQQVLDCILQANLFPLIRQRPFNKVADPNDRPRDIFVSLVNSAPLSFDISLFLQENKDTFQAGINALSRLTSGKVYISSRNGLEFENSITQIFQGPHPAGNVGIQIHHIKPIKPGDVVWTVDAQNVITLGKLFIEGKFIPDRLVGIGGSGSSDPFICSTIMGCSISDILKNQNFSSTVRTISGDVLTGTKVSENDFLGFYDFTISILLDEVERPFMGMLALGNSKTKYSLTNTFLSFGKNLFDFNTAQKGELRPIVPLNAWEKVLPMDIYPNHLYRAILAEDIEEMEQLGIWECDDEDFALCSFACPSKIDVGEVIRHGLNLIEADA
tara:strand:- start:97 stop:1293 length:1197 start_codon:yes stop_codon:yes gene_type:complete